MAHFAKVEDGVVTQVIVADSHARTKRQHTADRVLCAW
jgi:hypothetical protein